MGPVAHTRGGRSGVWAMPGGGATGIIIPGCCGFWGDEMDGLPGAPLACIGMGWGEDGEEVEMPPVPPPPPPSSPGWRGDSGGVFFNRSPTPLLDDVFMLVFNSNAHLYECVLFLRVH